MKKNIYMEKVADINVKTDFFANAIEGRIIDELFKAIPLLKDQNYKLITKNRSDDSGDLIAVCEIKIPEIKNPKGLIKINIPIFINNYRMKPIDTFVVNNVAYPTDDSILKELLIDPEHFRVVTEKEIKNTRVLAKLASIDRKNLVNSLKEVLKSNPNETIASVANNMIKNAADLDEIDATYNEPISDCLVERDKDFDFKIHYIKQASDGRLNFHTDKLDSKGVRTLMEAMGYNTETSKIADDLNAGKQVHLKSPLMRPNDNTQTYPYDPSTMESANIFNTIENGPAKIMDSKGKEKTGIVFDLYNFSDVAMNSPVSKLFIDYNKNYIITASFDGESLEEEPETLLKSDNPEPGDMGVFIDRNKNTAYGPVKILNFISDGKDTFLDVKIREKKYRVKYVDILKNYFIDGSDILLPKGYNWVALKEKLTIFEHNVNDQINKKIAEDSYSIVKVAGDEFRLKRFLAKTAADKSPVVPIENSAHLKLLLMKLNLISKDLTSVIDSLENGKPITFFTSFPMRPMFQPKEKAAQPVNLGLPENVSVKVIKIVKENLDPLKDIFPSIFKLAGNQDTTEFMDSITKEAATSDTLDTIFSLNLIGETNTAIFIENLEKLKFTVSYLSALLIYIRYGYVGGIKEQDVINAINSLNEIVKGLELVKTKKILDKQLGVKVF